MMEHARVVWPEELDAVAMVSTVSVILRNGTDIV
ncbi:hypothetical protein PC128_g26947 [Phytophthora cactorum]|nr:hypothetical protein PC128_g26947 [Phytophthora cactorum]